MKAKYYNKEEYDLQKRISKMEGVKTGDYTYARSYCCSYETIQEHVQDAINELKNK